MKLKTNRRVFGFSKGIVLGLILAGLIHFTVQAIDAENDPEYPWIPERLEQFKDYKFGFMVHFGIYSQWGCIESWPLVEQDKWARPDDLKAWTERGKNLEQFQKDYFALAKTFNPTNFNPEQWVKMAKDAGMKYVVFTTKHHDGFTLFDTKLTDFRITGPDVSFHTNVRSNVVREVFDAFRKNGFAIGAYFSKADWHHPDYWVPGTPFRNRDPNYNTLEQPEKWARFVDFTHKQIEELVSGYGPIDILWLDSNWLQPPKRGVDMDKLVAIARKHQPRLLVVDRGAGTRHENYRTPEQEVPDKPLPYAWETCMTMGEQWSYKPDDKYKTTHRLIHLLVDIVGKGGNFLLNVGPQPDGEIPAIAQERMREIGEWLKVNGEAIYGTRPIAPYKEGDVVFTQKGPNVYAIYLTKIRIEGLPEKITLSSLKPKPGSKVRLLGSSEPIKWETGADGTTTIEVPAAAIKTPPCQNAFAFEFQTAQ